MINTELAHFNMIEQQIRPWDVHLPSVLDALEVIRRQDFVPQAYARYAFADIQIPLESGGFMLEPKLAARMIQALELQPEERVMQVGVGAGYTSALLSRVANQVRVVADKKACVALAQGNLAMAGISNVSVEQGDATAGWQSAGELDAILIHGAVAEVNPMLFKQLAQGGRLVAIVGSQAPMELMQYVKHGDEITALSVVDTAVPDSSSEAVSKKAFVF